MVQLISKHPRVARFVLLAASLTAALCLVEVAVRATGGGAPSLWRPDPHLGWAHIPGAVAHWTAEGDGWVEINDLGMRDVERTAAKAPGVFRIAVFGDSVTEAVQVNLDQTFCQLLESRLRMRGFSVEVMNLGINGYSPLQEYLLYKGTTKALAPDLVIHTAFLDNDIADTDPALATNQDAPFIIDGSGDLAVDFSRAETSHRDYTRAPIFTIRRLSATYRAISAVRSAWLQRAFVNAAAASNEGIPKRYLLYEDPAPESWQRAWVGFERIVVQFARDVRMDGARYVMVSAPAGQVVYDSAWRQILDEHPAMKQRRWQLLGPEQKLKDLAARHGLDLITPLDAFKDHSSKGPLFFGLVGHLTPLGHQIMADTLEEALVGRGLLPNTSRKPGGQL